jgi:hypothetical protein
MDELKNAVDRDEMVRSLKEEFRSARREVDLRGHLVRNLDIDQVASIKTAASDESAKAIEGTPVEAAPRRN